MTLLSQCTFKNLLWLMHYLFSMKISLLCYFLSTVNQMLRSVKEDIFGSLYIYNRQTAIILFCNDRQSYLFWDRIVSILGYPPGDTFSDFYSRGYCNNIRYNSCYSAEKYIWAPCEKNKFRYTTIALVRIGKSIEMPPATQSNSVQIIEERKEALKYRKKRAQFQFWYANQRKFDIISALFR